MHKSLVKKPRQSLIPSSLLSTSMSAEERSAKTAAVQTTQRNTLKPRCPMTQVSREKEPNQLQYSMMACVSAQVWPGCPVTPFQCIRSTSLVTFKREPHTTNTYQPPAETWCLATFSLETPEPRATQARPLGRPAQLRVSISRTGPGAGDFNRR